MIWDASVGAMVACERGGLLCAEAVIGQSTLGGPWSLEDVSCRRRCDLGPNSRSKDGTRRRVAPAAEHQQASVPSSLTSLVSPARAPAFSPQSAGALPYPRHPQPHPSLLHQPSTTSAINVDGACPSNSTFFINSLIASLILSAARHEEHFNHSRRAAGLRPGRRSQDEAQQGPSF